MGSKTHSHIRVTSAIISLFLIGSAAAGTWDGGSAVDSNTGTQENWDGNTLPDASGADIIFAGSARTDVHNDYLTNVKSITFASGASAFTIGGNSFEVAAGGVIENETALLQTIDADMVQ